MEALRSSLLLDRTRLHAHERDDAEMDEATLAQPQQKRQRRDIGTMCGGGVYVLLVVEERLVMVITKLLVFNYVAYFQYGMLKRVTRSDQSLIRIHYKI